MTAIISDYANSNFTVYVTYWSPDLLSKFGSYDKTVEFDIIADTRKEAKELAIAEWYKKSWNCSYSVTEVDIYWPSI